MCYNDAMTKLSVNVNKVATIRNTRHTGQPDLRHITRIALQAGAQGITVHPRPDERHVRSSDVPGLFELVRQFEAAEFNLEGNPFHGRFMEFCQAFKPTQATLVPDTPAQNTSDHGWDLRHDRDRLSPVVEKLKSHGIRVSLFMDADERGIELASKLGVDRVELYTEPYAAGFARRDASPTRHYTIAARVAGDLNIGVNAGHDLNRDNLGPFLRAVPNVLEVSIGHALISDAIEMGIASAVQAYLSILVAAK